MGESYSSSPACAVQIDRSMLDPSVSLDVDASVMIPYSSPHQSKVIFDERSLINAAYEIGVLEAIGYART